jgi:hypothetical protein
VTFTEASWRTFDGLRRADDRADEAAAAGPVVAALSVLIAGYAVTIGSASWAGGVELVAGVIAGILTLALIYGLWRGNPLARWLVISLLAVNVISGIVSRTRISGWRELDMAVAVAIAALLSVPASSRRWFTDPPRGSAPNPDPPKEQPMDTEALWEDPEASERR